MSDLYAQFSAFLSSYCSSQSRLIIGLSGGVDSRVLLALTARYSREKQVSCIAVHVHHGLSPNADDWAAQCALWCEQSGVELIVEKVSLMRQGGESIEQLAREARYTALKKHIQSANDCLLIGQHADDQLESFFLALKRGSGPKGLASMAAVAPFGAGKRLRPLLQIRRHEIEAFAQQQQLDWVEDESNQDIRFDRNFIRHHVVPHLSERWPAFPQAAQRSASLCAQQEALLDELLEDKYQQLQNDDLSVSIDALKKCSDLMRQRLLRMWFQQHQYPMPSLAHLGRIWAEVACAQSDANPRLKLGKCEVRRFNGCLYLVPHQSDVTDWKHDIKCNQELILPDHLGSLCLQCELMEPVGVLGMDLSECDPNHFWVTFNPQGLSAHPVERGHRRKLKKLFQEYGVPSWLRRRIPILMYQDNVVCVAGLFIDRAFSGQSAQLIWRP